MRSFFTPKRLSVYPRLFLVATWSVVLANMLFRKGWQGGMGQIIGIDFLILYAAGKLYLVDIAHLYDFPAQLALQRELISPTVLPGSGPFSNPPFVAAAYALLTHLPLVAALVIWSGFMIAAIATASYLAHRFLAPKWLIEIGLTRTALLTVLLSSFAFVAGLQAGQNHGLTLLLVTGICVASLGGRWLLAGTLGGLLLYKPQFVLGFLLVWLVWRRWKALLAFVAVTALWVGAVLFTRGLQPYLDFFDFSGQILALPYIPGWPGYLLLTPFGLLATLLPSAAFSAILWFSRGFGVVLAIMLMLFAQRARRGPIQMQRLLLALAVLFPLIATPYALLHDLLVIVPVLLLMADDRSKAQSVLYLAIAAYVGALIAPVIGAATHMALPALIPMGVLWVLAGRVITMMRVVPATTEHSDMGG